MCVGGERTRTQLSLGLLLLCGGLRDRVETGLLLLLRLGTVRTHTVSEIRQGFSRDALVEELEELRGRVLVERVRELGDGGRDLEALAEDDVLALEADVLGPVDEAGQVVLRPDVLPCTRARVDERPVSGWGR